MPRPARSLPEMNTLAVAVCAALVVYYGVDTFFATRYLP